MNVYVYVVAEAGTDPARIRCPVPWRVDRSEIFFGACKKRLREKLRQRWLGPGVAEARPDGKLWLVGLYPSGRTGPRHVLFAGRITRVMTFARAYDSLVDDQYATMRAREVSPIHLQPIYRRGTLVGYEHRGRLHAKSGAWVRDVASAHSQLVDTDGERCSSRAGARRGLRSPAMRPSRWRPCSGDPETGAWRLMMKRSACSGRHSLRSQVSAPARPSAPIDAGGPLAFEART